MKDKINILFVGSDFMRKGGYQSLKAFSLLNKKKMVIYKAKLFVTDFARFLG